MYCTFCKCVEWPRRDLWVHLAAPGHAYDLFFFLEPMYA